MKFTEKLKSYKFWVSLTSAVIIFLQTLGQQLGFNISQEVITNIVMTFCSILVVLGLINDDRNTPSSPLSTSSLPITSDTPSENLSQNTTSLSSIEEGISNEPIPPKAE